MTTREHALAVTGLSVAAIRERDGNLPIVRDVSYSVQPGEMLALIGESGSGKTMSALGLVGLLSPSKYNVSFQSLRLGELDLGSEPSRQWRLARGERAAMIFQDAAASLNPAFRVGWQISESLRVRRGVSRRNAHQRAIELMTTARIPDAPERVNSYPHQLSGGLQQRVMIAMALALDPDVVVADEPTTALDVTVEAQVMNLLAELCRSRQLAVVLITHDISLAVKYADRIAVMYAGRIVETGPSTDVRNHPRHPYTHALLRAIPGAEADDGKLVEVEGRPPDFEDLPSGCSFHPRCPYADEQCRRREPLLRQVGAMHSSACHYAESFGETDPVA